MNIINDDHAKLNPLNLNIAVSGVPNIGKTAVICKMVKVLEAAGIKTNVVNTDTHQVAFIQRSDDETVDKILNEVGKRGVVVDFTERFMHRGSVEQARPIHRSAPAATVPMTEVLAATMIRNSESETIKKSMAAIKEAVLKGDDRQFILELGKIGGATVRNAVRSIESVRPDIVFSQVDTTKE